MQKSSNTKALSYPSTEDILQEWLASRGNANPRGGGINISQLRVFVAACEIGSISLTSRRLGLSQSAISQSITIMERSIGAKILSRSRSGVQVTEVGTQILPYAQIAVAAADRITNISSNLKSSNSPELLRISAVPSALNILVKDFISSMKDLYPAMKTNLFVGHHIEVTQRVREAVTHVGVTAIHPSDLYATEVSQEELILVGRFGHPAVRQDKVDLQSLSNDILVTTSKSCEEVFYKAFHQEKLPMRTLTGHSTETALDMVRAGIGVTIIPRSMLDTVDMTNLRVRSFEPRASRPLMLVCRPEYANSDLYRAVYELMRASSDRDQLALA